MTPIERAARALWKLDCERLDADNARKKMPKVVQWADPWHKDGYGVRQQKSYLEDARAVIESLREPDSDLLVAATNGLDGVGIVILQQDARDLWAAIIDTILETLPPTDTE